MSAAVISFRANILPWAVSPEDEARFRRILNIVLAVCVLLCILLLLWPKPQVDRAAPPEVPQRLAKLVIEQRETPPAPGLVHRYSTQPPCGSSPALHSSLKMNLPLLSVICISGRPTRSGRMGCATMRSRRQS